MTLRKLIKYLNLVAFIALVAMTLGCTDDNPVLQVQRGSISGQVTDANLKPIQGAIVTSNRSLFRAETDEMGRYVFTSLDTGHHHLSVERDGYYLGSATVELAYGQVLSDVNIIVEELEKMLTAVVAVRERTSAVLDIKCHEPMSISVMWREMSNMPSNTLPTEKNTQHRVVLNNLFPGSEYWFEVTGTTDDGRQFTSGLTSFKTVHMNDIDGPPASPENFTIAKSLQGPVLSWTYSGKDPIQGFRILRGENSGNPVVLRDENDVLSSQTSITDDMTIPGRHYEYSVYAVDYEGNLSEIPAKKSCIANGTISENLVWKKAWSPIEIEGDFVIAPRYTLTIEPGTVIAFKPFENNGNAFRNNVSEFIIEGSIDARGTVDEPIRFVSQSSIPERNDWDGIRFSASTDGQTASVLDNVIVSGADTGLKLYGSNITVSNYTARYCKTGLAVNTASGTFVTNLVFEDCDVGLQADGTYNTNLWNVKVSRCAHGIVTNNNCGLVLNDFEIRDVTQIGIQSCDRENTSIKHGVIHSLAKGLTISGDTCDAEFLTIDARAGVVLEGAENAVVQNNIIVNQISAGSGNGIEDMTSGNAYPFNNIFGFANATYNCTQFGSTIQNVDPVFMGTSVSGFDYHLAESSPLLNSSSNNGPLGAYGY